MLMEPRRLLAIPHGLIAIGVAFRLHTFIAHGAADTGLWIAIVLSLVAAIGSAATVFGTIDPAPWHYQFAGALYIGITIIVALARRQAPVDVQIANLLLFGGFGLTELVHWHVMAREQVTA